MFYYGTVILARGRLVMPQEDIEKLYAVTAEEVRAVAQDIFKPENRSLSCVLPK